MTDYLSLTSLNLDQLLSQIVERAKEIIPFDSGGITVYNPDTDRLALRTYQSSSPDVYMPDLIKTGEGVIGTVAKTREPLLIADVTADPNYVAADPDTRSEMAAPIIFADRLLGVFNVECHRSDVFTTQHLKILQTLADEAALALNTARLYVSLSQRYERLTDYSGELLLRNEISSLATSDVPLDVLLPQMAERLAKLVNAHACALTLWDAANQRTRRLAAYGIDLSDFLSERRRPAEAPSLTSDIVRNGKPVILNDAQSLKDAPTPFITEYEARAILAMPLTARGRPIGAAFLMNLRDDHPFTQNHVDKASSALDQIALTIDNHLLLEDTQARLSETSILLEIAAIASSSLDLEDMLRQVLAMCRKMLGVGCGALIFYDRQTNTLSGSRKSSFGFPDTLDLDTLRFPVTDPRSNIAVVFSSGSPYISNDVSVSTHDDYLNLVLASGLRNFMLAPLRVQDEPMGVFLVGNKNAEFTRTDANLLMAMGSHVAAALRNADLLEDTRARLRETEALQRIAAITSSTLNLDEMLESAVREAAELLEVEGAILMIPDPVEGALIPHQKSRYGIAKQMPYGPVPLGAIGHMTYVYHSGEPYVSNDAPSNPLLNRRNIITYPLSTRDRTFGILSLLNRKSGDFEETHVDLTRAIASQIATSIENAQLFAAERARADQMALINRISQELTATLNLPDLLHQVVRAVHELLGYEGVAIALLDEDGSQVTLGASFSTVPGLVGDEGLSFSVTRGVIGRAVRSGETQVVNDVRQDPDFFVVGDISIAGSSLVAPLRRAATRILGAIEIISLHTNRFQKTDQLAMETLASQVAIAIENARLWEQAQKRLLEQHIVHQIGQDLTAILQYNELVNAVVQHMTRALDTGICLLTSYDEETGQLIVEAEYRVSDVANHPLPRFLGQPPGINERMAIARAVQTRRPIITYRGGRDVGADQQEYFEEFGIYAQLTLPMIVNDRVIGCVLWIETRNPREFTGSDERLAQTLAAQAAIAIENARLFRQAQRQAREQELLRSVALSLSIMPDVDAMLHRLAVETARAFEADNVIIALRGESGYNVHAQQLTTMTPEYTLLGHLAAGTSMPGVLGVMEAGQTLQFGTLATPGGDNPLIDEITATVGHRSVSLVLTPMIRREKVVGLIEVSSDVGSRAFDPQEIELLQALANQGAIAMDNISLSQREQRRLRQMERLQVSTRKMAGQLQVDALLETVVHEAAEIFDVPAAMFMRLELGEDYLVNQAYTGLSPEYVRDRRLPVKILRQPVDAATRPLYVPDISVYDESQEDLRIQEGLRSLLVIPLVKAGQFMGILNLYTKGEIRTFTDEELDLALLFAGQAAIAYENALLFQKVEDRAVELMKANQLKSEFLARVSHELRTPMNSINGYSQLLLDGTYGEMSQKQADRIDRILRNGRNLLALIDDLLDLSKIDAGKMVLQIEPVNLREELAATIYNLESQAGTRGLYLKLEAPEDLPLVRADQFRVKQIVTNLLGNAMKFTKQGGVTVRTSIVKKQGKSFVLTSVIDTGIGIKEEDQDIIFDEFRQVDGSTTREYGGTGLGLAISKKLVELMAGTIWVDSEFGQGSTFTFSLPVAGED